MTTALVVVLFSLCAAQVPKDIESLARAELERLECHGERLEGDRLFYRCKAGIVGSLDLENLRKNLAEVHNEKNVPDVVRAFVRNPILANSATTARPKREQFLMTFKSREALEAVLATLPGEAQAKARLPVKSLAGDIVICPVADQPNTMSMITVRDLERWGMSVDEVWNLAIENLYARGYTPELIHVPGGRPLVKLRTGDSYDAVRILLPKAREAMGKLLGGPPVFAVPSRDVALAVRGDDPVAVAMLRRVAQAMHDKSAYALSPSVLRYDPLLRTWAEVP